MPFSKCLRAKIYSNLNVDFGAQGCQTLLSKESEHLFLFGLLDYKELWPVHHFIFYMNMIPDIYNNKTSRWT